MQYPKDITQQQAEEDLMYSFQYSYLPTSKLKVFLLSLFFIFLFFLIF